jgi:hypothetical protein
VSIAKWISSKLKYLYTNSQNIIYTHQILFGLHLHL